jgi:ATP-dependent RNA helicase DeaD
MIGHFARTRILNKPMRMQLIGEANSGFSRRDRFEKGYTPRNGDRPNRQYRSSKPQTVSHCDR